MTNRIIEFAVPAEKIRARADKIFAAQFNDVSRARLQRAFDAGLVSFDGVTIEKAFKVKRPGLLRASLEEPDFNSEPVGQNLPLNIIFEDNSLLVVNKAPGMVVHPGCNTKENTLVHALIHHCGKNLSSVGTPNRPGIVHRLDKETSGLIVVAKNNSAHYKLASSFSERKTYKRYTALVLGSPKRNFGTIKKSIGRHPILRTRMAIAANGKTAHTDWKVEAHYKETVTQLSCIIHTGRTHQIRVHMSDLRCPLLGDTTYGFKARNLEAIKVPRIMLHASELRIQHPQSRQLQIFKAPLPVDFKQIISDLKL